MRAAKCLVVVLAFFVMNSCGAVQASSVNSLQCETKGDSAVALCHAMRADLMHRDSGANGPAHLLLIASAPRPNSLRAKIDVISGARRHEGEQGELSVMDRREISKNDLNNFAKVLVDRAILLGHLPRRRE